MFSFKTREEALKKFKTETFDLLIVGGGITGAATARDAALRGLSVALVERSDFAYGTSSRSSKLIHGGLRYLENFEFGLVFEALAERALLLKTAPHLVAPLPFFLPVYKGDPHRKGLLSLGLWLYDFLALFRTPGSHKSLSRNALLECIPFLRDENLVGGFRYHDASMWDDVLAVQTLRSAAQAGAQVANYVEALEPIWKEGIVSGFRVRDRETEEELPLHARRVVVCAGPWTDEVGRRVKPDWNPWLNPSKGVHLVFDLKRIPVPGALVMSHPQDGRIAFVIPRPEYGAGVVIVGTTDGPTASDPEKASIDPGDVEYLMRLLHRYFPRLDLKTSDILSAYIGVRPLMASGPGTALQKVSREHHIGLGPGQSVWVAGGKYTTHRKMAEEIVDFTLKAWKTTSAPDFPKRVLKADSTKPINPHVLPEAVAVAQAEASSKNLSIPDELLYRYGREALGIAESEAQAQGAKEDPDGFPRLAAQLSYAIRNEMVVHLEDFYLRRVPLYASRADHGMPWAEELAGVWGRERGVGSEQVAQELSRLRAEVERRSEWRSRL